MKNGRTDGHCYSSVCVDLKLSDVLVGCIKERIKLPVIINKMVSTLIGDMSDYRVVQSNILWLTI